MNSTLARLSLPDENATRALAARLAPRLAPGDVILLHGPIGAGKTAFARAIIQTLLAQNDQHEDVPSPTFTLVQVYETPGMEIWHADLYRLSSADEAFELGLTEAFTTALCLIEWPERLGADAPPDALNAHFAQGVRDDARELVLCSTSPRWHDIVADITETEND